jgi:hypothetical protein
MKKLIACFILVVVCGLAGFAQAAKGSKGAKAGEATNKATKTDIDPLALDVLKAATEPLRKSQSFSFRALVSREYLGTNGQVITLFNLSDVTVQRPDKMHIDFRGRGKKVSLFYNAGQAVLYSPDEKLYTTIAGEPTIDATLQDLEKRDVFIPIRNFLESDPYKSLSDGLLTAYVIGKSMLFDQEVHQLAFTEPKAEWQLWVIGGERPLIRRLQVIDKTQPERPRIVVDFLDWNLNASPSADLFTFKKPPDAKEIGLLKETQK